MLDHLLLNFMRIETELKLGFKHVMIRPKRSTLKSRSQVSLEREFKFLHSSTTWSGIPIMGANMDTVGTFEMALALAKEKLFTAIHKHYSVDEWSYFIKNAPENIEDYIAVSSGTGKNDFKKIGDIFEQNPQLKFICIDVANGYSEHFVTFLKQARNQYPDKVIIAGNVVTGEIVEELLLAGADIVKVGIGPGSVCTTRVKLVLVIRNFPPLSNVPMQLMVWEVTLLAMEDVLLRVMWPKHFVPVPILLCWAEC